MRGWVIGLLIVACTIGGAILLVRASSITPATRSRVTSPVSNEAPPAFAPPEISLSKPLEVPSPEVAAPMTGEAPAEKPVPVSPWVPLNISKELAAQPERVLAVLGRWGLPVRQEAGELQIRESEMESASSVLVLAGMMPDENPASISDIEPVNAETPLPKRLRILVACRSTLQNMLPLPLGVKSVEIQIAPLEVGGSDLRVVVLLPIQKDAVLSADGASMIRGHVGDMMESAKRIEIRNAMGIPIKIEEGE